MGRAQAILFIGVSLVIGCASISPFSQTAYEQATALKAEALVIMDEATEDYAAHEADAARLRLQMERAYEYAKGRPKNDVTARQWEIIRDPERHSLGGFLRRWEKEGRLGATFIDEAKREVTDGLDHVIALESGKQKP